MPEVAVSLTSYPARIGAVGRTIRSILRQKTTPDVIFLALARDEFHGGTSDLPASLQRLIRLHSEKIEVVFTDNSRSYKKILPALSAFGAGSTIVTADDDVTYPTDWLAGLLAGSQATPNASVGTRGTLMRADKDGLSPYVSWPAAPLDWPHPAVFLTGRGGILYPPGSLQHASSPHYADVAPSADDVWLKCATLSAGFASARVGSGREYRSNGASQGGALHKKNVPATRGRSVNDDAIRACLAHFSLTLSDLCLS